MTENPLAGFLKELDEEALTEQARVEGLLESYRDNQDAANRFSKEAAALGAQIKQFLQLNPDVELYDEKANLSARLQTRRLPGHFFDFIAIRDGNTALLNRLIACGALTVNWEAAKAQGLDGELRRYEIPVGETTALQVVRK